MDTNEGGVSIRAFESFPEFVGCKDLRCSIDHNMLAASKRDGPEAGSLEKTVA
jgi:hypothetical protein